VSRSAVKSQRYRWLRGFGEGQQMEIVTNYFTHRSNSGWVEGLNNKIKALKRRCYGITNPISLFRRIWLDLSGYEAFAH
jgi:transposase